MRTFGCYALLIKLSYLHVLVSHDSQTENALAYYGKKYELQVWHVLKRRAETEKVIKKQLSVQ